MIVAAMSSDPTLVGNQPSTTSPPGVSEFSALPHRSRINRLVGPNAPLRPFRLIKSDLKGIKARYSSDWFFNQLILASAVYLFFTNLLPGITFSSDLYVLTDKNYGAIEVVFSTGLCGCIFAL